jgi:similar to stage IV sporulation protein
MRSEMISWFRGYIQIEVRSKGGQPVETLLNSLLKNGIVVWDIHVNSGNRLQCFVYVSDFHRLRPLLKETGCRVHVSLRSGFPFLLLKLSKRKLLGGGIIAFIVSLYLLSSLVWQVTVSGNEKIATSQIIEAAHDLGIYKFQWKYKVDDFDAISTKLQMALPGTTWVGVEMRGTHLIIHVVEATIPEKKPLMNPRNLVASKNAVITEILASKGKPLVRPNTYVRKGDVLISGIIGEGANQKIVVANGIVKGIVWYLSKIEVPLVQKYKVYTGEEVTRNYVVTGTRALKLTGYGKLPFTAYETIPTRSALHFRGYTLPIGWLKEKIMEMHEVQLPITQEEARTQGLAKARSELLQAAGKDSRIVNEKLLHEKTENGKVYIEVHFEVEESILQEQPIVTQGE